MLVWFCRFPLPLGAWEGLRFMIVALPGLFSYLFFCDCGTPWTFLLPFLLRLWHSLDFSLTFSSVIVALPRLFSHLFFCDCGTPWTFLLPFLLRLWHSLDFSLTFSSVIVALPRLFSHLFFCYCGTP